MSPVSKAEQDRRQRRPIQTGVHTLREVATLIHEGKTHEEIAALWQMRPRAGPHDLWFDVVQAWERSGSPGGLPRPTGRGDDAWAAWRQARGEAISAWLESIRTGAVFLSRVDLESEIRRLRAERDEMRERVQWLEEAIRGLAPGDRPEVVPGISCFCRVRPRLASGPHEQVCLRAYRALGPTKE